MFRLILISTLIILLPILESCGCGGETVYRIQDINCSVLTDMEKFIEPSDTVIFDELVIRFSFDTYNVVSSKAMNSSVYACGKHVLYLENTISEVEIKGTGPLGNIPPDSLLNLFLRKDREADYLEDSNGGWSANDEDYLLTRLPNGEGHYNFNFKHVDVEGTVYENEINVYLTD